MKKQKITDEQVQAALDVLKDWFAEDVNGRCCLTIAFDITASNCFYRVCGSDDDLQAALIYGISLSERIRKAFISDVGMLIGQGILRLRGQIDGSTFPRPEQKVGQA